MHLFHSSSVSWSGNNLPIFFFKLFKRSIIPSILLSLPPPACQGASNFLGPRRPFPQPWKCWWPTALNRIPFRELPSLKQLPGAGHTIAQESPHKWPADAASGWDHPGGPFPLQSPLKGSAPKGSAEASAVTALSPASLSTESYPFHSLKYGGNSNLRTTGLDSYRWSKSKLQEKTMQSWGWLITN